MICLSNIKRLSWVVGVLFVFSAKAQNIEAVSTKYSNDFSEWYLYTDDKNEIGTLTARWQQRRDISEWDFRIGEVFGAIKLLWKDDPSEWELRTNNKVVTMKTVYRGDFSEWRITDNTTTVTLKTTFSNHWDEWELRNFKEGSFHAYTTTDFDPRDWEIEDYNNLPFHIRMAMIFIVIYNAIPQK